MVHRLARSYRLAKAGQGSIYWVTAKSCPRRYATHSGELSADVFYGNDLNYVLEGTTQNILDFFSDPCGEKTVGVALSSGVLLDANGNPNGAAVPPMYRTLGFNGSPLNLSSPTDAIFPLKGTYPRWVTCFNVLPLIEERFADLTIAAALVSLELDADGTQELASTGHQPAEQPQLVNKIAIPSTVFRWRNSSRFAAARWNAGSARPAESCDHEPGVLALPTPKGTIYRPAIISVTPQRWHDCAELGFDQLRCQIPWPTAECPKSSNQRRRYSLSTFPGTLD